MNTKTREEIEAEIIGRILEQMLECLPARPARPPGSVLDGLTAERIRRAAEAFNQDDAAVHFLNVGGMRFPTVEEIEKAMDDANIAAGRSSGNGRTPPTAVGDLDHWKRKAREYRRKLREASKGAERNANAIKLMVKENRRLLNERSEAERLYDIAARERSQLKLEVERLAALLEQEQASSAVGIERCDVCNAELVSCGIPGPDGEPSADCLLCQLRNRSERQGGDNAKLAARIKELEKQLAGVGAPAQRAILVLREELEQVNRLYSAKGRECEELREKAARLASVSSKLGAARAQLTKLKKKEAK